MNRNTMMKRVLAPALVLGVAGLASAPAVAVDYYLCAGAVTKTMPGGVPVPMWGFAQVANAPAQVPGCGAGATVPGPKLLVPAGDSLTVHLYNDALPEPISLVIPGQALPDGSSPVLIPDGQGRERVRSFTFETASGAAQAYTWSMLQPGSYPYQSGTHPQVQVQMGLYGPMTRDAAVGEAYSGVPYDTERDVFFSEIDPALHAAVHNGTYGTTGPTSTLEYVPKYFLVNGEPFEDGDPCLGASVAQGDRVLLRLYNEGLRELTPMMLGSHFEVVAEGGHKYGFARKQYSVLLPPGSTKDVVFTPSQGGTFAIFDRRLNLTNGPATGGGFRTCLSVDAGPAPSKHVGDLDGLGVIRSAYTWQATVRITVHDQDHNPVQGAIVSRSWTPAGYNGGPNNTATCTTDASGRCLLSRLFRRAQTASATLTVTGLTGAGGPDQPADNHDPDGDSNGTSIVVPRP